MTNETAWRLCTRMIGTVALAGLGMIPAALADTQPAYDRRIEEAAIKMLQPKLGEIRGSLDLETEAHLYPPLNERMPRGQEAGMAASLPPGVRQGSFIRY